MRRSRIPEAQWANMTPIEKELATAPNTWLRNGVVLTIVGVIVLWSSSSITMSNVVSGGLKVVVGIFKGLLRPDWSLWDLSAQGIPYLLFETFCIAFLGTVVGAILAIPLSFLAAPNIVPRPIAVVGRVIVMAIRTIPVVIYGLMFVRVTGPGPFAGLMTMGLASIGMVSKMYVEYIEDLDPRILESLDAAGCTLFQKIRFGIVPQLIPDFLSTIIYRFDMNLRDATTLGLVAAGGIGAPLIFAFEGYKWDQAGSILWGLVVLILIIEFTSTKMRAKLARG